MVWPRSSQGRDPWRRVQISGVVLIGVTAAGTMAYWLLGLAPLDALYQTVTTISTVGFREYGEATAAWQITTILVILVGAGSALYALGVLLETLVEGRLTDRLGGRRTLRRINAMQDHYIVCGWGRVGRTIGAQLVSAGREVVVIEIDESCPQAGEPTVLIGDATEDDVLRSAGVDRAACLIAALSNDADNLYATLSARAIRDDLLIVARARTSAAATKLRRAGADRVVNPQEIGGARMAAMAIQPAVVDFLDVVMHDGTLEFRLEEVDLLRGSELTGSTLGSTNLRERTGALILAVRRQDGTFVTNPPPDFALAADQKLIAIGTTDQLQQLRGVASLRP